MRIMLDTSVWIRTRTDQNIKDIVSALLTKREVATCEMIDREMADACAFLKRKQIQGADELEAFYRKVKRMQVPASPGAKELVNEYSTVASQFGLTDRQISDMEGDLTIMAFASIGNASFVLTFNRHSLGSDLARLIYRVVNEKTGLEVPTIITEEGSIRNLLLV